MMPSWRAVMAAVRASRYGAAVAPGHSTPGPAPGSVFSAAGSALTHSGGDPSITAFDTRTFWEGNSHGRTEATNLPRPPGETRDPPAPQPVADPVLHSVRRAGPAAPRLPQLRLLPEP